MRILYILLFFSCSIIFTQGARSQDSIPRVQPTSLDIYNQLDAAFHLEEEDKNYFFKQKVYLRLSGIKIDQGYPSKIQNGWKEFPQYWNSGIDAALRCEPSRTTIFFKGREYFTIQNGYQTNTFPKKLPGEFKNLPRFFHSNIDAAVYLGSSDQMYFFKGNQYVRLKNNMVEQGYPRKLPGEFIKLPKEFYSDIDAVLHRNGKTFFYKNGQYAVRKVLAGFQKETGTK